MRRDILRQIAAGTIPLGMDQMAIDIERRKFISALGGTAVVWPLTARAQQPERIRRIGVLMGIGVNDPGGQSEAAALKRGLQELGWTEARNLEIKFSWSGGQLDLIEGSAKELVGLHCEVIIARGTPVVAALLKETQTIPIVFTVVVDPVGSGFVHSYAQPGGSVTGFQNFEFTMVGKWVQLLEEIAPQVRRVSFIYNPTTTPSGFLRSLETVAPSISVQLVAAPVHGSDEIDAALAALAHEPDGGFLVLPDIFMIDYRAQIIELAAQHRLPAIYTSGLWTKNRGLMSYGPDTPDLFYRAAGYVDRILKGEKPANLPVQAPTKYQLVINLKTASALGLTVPPTMIARADEVFE
jgi:putative ABC transport system substrate-binding protein